MKIRFTGWPSLNPWDIFTVNVVSGGGPSLGSATPLVESGAGAAGSAAAASHEDHVHPAGADVGFANPMTTAADLIVGGTAGAAARLAKGSDGQVLTVDPVTHLLAWAGRVGCRAYNSANIALAGATEVALGLDSEAFDTSGLHFTSAAALTGTVAKTSGSAAVVGTGTAFTTELSVNQCISIPGGATEKAVVTAIADNTHLTVSKNLANTASGQTATRINSPIAVPAGMGGLWLATTAQSFAQSATGSREAYIYVNHTHASAVALADSKDAVNSASNPTNRVVTYPLNLNDGDWVEGFGYQASGGSLNSLNIGTDMPSLALLRWPG